MNRNQKEAMIAGIELAERAHAMEDAQARALLVEAQALLRVYAGEHRAEQARGESIAKRAGPSTQETLQPLIDAARMKADVLEAFDARLEEFLK